MEKETKVCKHCQTEIPKKAKVCPQCRKKQGGIGKWIIIALVVFFIIGLFGGGEESETPTDNQTNNESNSESSAEKEYTACTVGEMVSALEENALNAENTYQDMYVEITGKLSVIDSDGSYISLEPANDDFSLVNVQCFIQNEEQLKRVAELKVGDVVTLRGQITDVGELLGYQLDIDSID